MGDPDRVRLWVVRSSGLPTRFWSGTRASAGNGGAPAGQVLDVVTAVDMTDSLPRRIGVSVDDEELLHVLITDIKVNSGIKDKAFAYSPPRGVEVTDMTGGQNVSPFGSMW